MSNKEDIKDIRARLDQLMLEAQWFVNDLEKLLERLEAEDESR